MYRSAWLREHGGQAVTKPVAEIPGARDRGRKPRHRPHHRGVVQRSLACILEFAEPFHVDRDFAAEHQDRRGVRLCGGDSGRHVAETGTANAEHRAEPPAGASIAVRHVGGAAFMGGHDGLQLGMTGERGKKGIDQAARHHEQVVDAFAYQCVQNKIRAGGHENSPSENIAMVAVGDCFSRGPSCLESYPGLGMPGFEAPYQGVGGRYGKIANPDGWSAIDR